MKNLAAIFFVISLAPQPAWAITGYVCSTTITLDSTGGGTFKGLTSIEKYKIAGQELVDEDNLTDAGWLPPEVYRIIENNSFGLIAVQADAQKADVGTSVSADIIIIDKQRMTLRSFYADSTDAQPTFLVGECTTY